MVRDDVPVAVRERLRQELLSLHLDEVGRAILAGSETARFLPASAESYEVVRAYVARFEAHVRKVEER